MAEFEPAVKLVLAHEGGYVNNPDDPGGETNFGISKRSYPDVDVAALTPEGAREIYRRDFWRYDAIADQALANCLLDCAVNQGVEAAAKLYERSSHAGLREFQTQRLMRYVRTLVANPKLTFALHSWFSRTLDV